MPEVTMNFYVKHQDRAMHRAIGKLLRALPDDEEVMFGAAERLAPGRGVALTQSLLESLDDLLYEATGLDDVEARHGYLFSSLTSGEEVVETAQLLVGYFHSLNDGIESLAYVYGDEDPWECWVKIHHGAPFVLECAPYSGDDAFIVGTVYRWWHEGLPSVIREGMLSESTATSLPLLPDAEYQAWLNGLDIRCVESQSSG